MKPIGDMDTCFKDINTGSTETNNDKVQIVQTSLRTAVYSAFCFLACSQGIGHCLDDYGVSNPSQPSL